MKPIKNFDLSMLTEEDLYSTLLYALYKLTDNSYFSTLAQLSFVVDKSSLLKLCELFGGQTITIPTVKQLKLLINAMMLYQYMDIEGYAYRTAIAKLNLKDIKPAEVTAVYKELRIILQELSNGK